MIATITSSSVFRARLREIRRFLLQQESLQTYVRLLDDLEHVVYPNLRAFPQIGNPYLDGPVQSTEALMATAKLPRNAAQSVRKYVHDAFVILYVALPGSIHLVSIRHQRESTFNP